MKYTIGQIKLLLDELDKEFIEIDENERAANRKQTIKLMAGLVNEWRSRGYGYAQIAEKLRMKGFMRISQKTLRQISTSPRKRKRTNAQQSSGQEREKNNATKKIDRQHIQQTHFTPRTDSDDI